MHRMRTVLALVLALPLATTGCGKDPEPSPEPPPIAWIYDGVRLLRYDLAAGALTRERLPGASLPLDDDAPDGTTGLEAAKSDPAVLTVLPSPDDRFLVYRLYRSASDQPLYAWDRGAGSERLLANTPLWEVGFLDGPGAVLFATSASGVHFFDLPGGTARTIDRSPCEARVAGAHVLLETPAQGGHAACGEGVSHRVLSWRDGKVAERPLELPWPGPEAFLDLDRASVAADGAALVSAYRRTLPEAAQHPLVLCDPDAARCVEVAPAGTFDGGMTGGFRALSRDGRTYAFVPRSHTLRVVAGGEARDVDLGGDAGTAVLEAFQAGDGEVFAVVRTGSGPGDTTVRLAAIDAVDGAVQSVWSAERPWPDPFAFDVAADRSRFLLTEYVIDTGTDMVTFHRRQARLIDRATGLAGDRLAGGGIPVLADDGMRRFLVSQDRGPAGHALVAGDPAGAFVPVADWKAAPDVGLWFVSARCGGPCPIGFCRAGAPLAVAPSILLDGAGGSWDLDEEATVTATTDPTEDAPGSLVVTGASGEHRFVVDLPPPYRLPVTVGETLSIVAFRPQVDDGVAPNVLGAWDADGFRFLFLGGAVLKDQRFCGGHTPCPTLAFGTTGCAPEALDGCGPVDHPPLVIGHDWGSHPAQAEQGGQGYAPGVQVVVFASTRPVDGPCDALGAGTAYALFTGNP